MITGHSGYAGQRPSVIGKMLVHLPSGKEIGMVEDAYFVGRDASSGLTDTDVRIGDRIYTLGSVWNIPELWS